VARPIGISSVLCCTSCGRWSFHLPFEWDDPWPPCKQSFSFYLVYANFPGDFL